MNKKCNHETGLLIRKYMINGNEISMVNCMNCGKKITGISYDVNKEFKNIIDISNEDDFEYMCEINKSLKLERR